MKNSTEDEEELLLLSQLPRAKGWLKSGVDLYDLPKFTRHKFPKNKINFAFGYGFNKIPSKIIKSHISLVRRFSISQCWFDGKLTWGYFLNSLKNVG